MCNRDQPIKMAGPCGCTLRVLNGREKWQDTFQSEIESLNGSEIETFCRDRKEYQRVYVLYLMLRKREWRRRPRDAF